MMMRLPLSLNAALRLHQVFYSVKENIVADMKDSRAESHRIVEHRDYFFRLFDEPL